MHTSLQEMVLASCSSDLKDWKKHILDVVSYANLLSKMLDANKEVCETAAWLHDITKIRGDPVDHHIKSAQEATRLLTPLLLQEHVERISSCIQSHTSDPTYPALTCEEQIVASADALSHLDYLLERITDYLFFTTKKDLSTKDKILQKTKKATHKLMLKEAQQIGRPKIHAISCLLQSTFDKGLEKEKSIDWIR